MALLSGSHTEPTPDADLEFFKRGIEYYVVARSAAIAGLPVAGNLYHHAVEMVLKGQLARTISLSVLWRKHRHHLRRAWKAFKKLFPNEELAPFDEILRKLDKFEDVRYPDKVLEKGASVTINWNPPAKPDVFGAAAVVPQYELAVTDIDRLLGRLFELCSVVPSAHVRLNRHALAILQNDNPIDKPGFFSTH